MRNLVLVDFDGVVLKSTNNQVSQFVKHKVNAYVQRKTKLHNKDLVNAFNAEVYQAHGHTVLGLRKHGIKCDVAEFNHWVYSDFHGRRELCMSSEERCDWLKFMDDMEECDLDVRFYSNASISWIKHFVGQDYKDEMFDFMNHVSATRHHSSSDEYLKPARSVYELVMSMYPRRMYYLLDDKLINFCHIAADPRWIKLWISGVSSASVHPGSAFFSLPDLAKAGALIQRFEDRTKNSHVFKL